MVKNIFGGKNAKKRAKKFVNNRHASRQLEKKQEGQEYAKLTKKLGDCRFECICADGINRVAHVPGKFRNRWRFQLDEYVLVSIRIGLEPLKCDILHKYTPTDVLQLQNENLIDLLNEQEFNEEAFMQEEVQENENPDEEQVEIDISNL